MITIPANIRSIVDHDGAVILDIPNNMMTGLDTTGAYVWQKLQNGLSVNSIIADLARDTGADQEMIARDVTEFMEKLKARHLVLTIYDNTRSEDVSMTNSMF